MANQIMKDLDKEAVSKHFPEKYFPKDQTVALLKNINDKCNWENRNGKFVDFFSKKNIGGINETAFIYEYFLDCDSLRFILNMNMEGQPQLMGFSIEPIEKDNEMILYPEKKLLNSK